MVINKLFLKFSRTLTLVIPVNLLLLTQEYLNCNYVFNLKQTIYVIHDIKILVRGKHHILLIMELLYWSGHKWD